jgi:hypothetical protein
MTAALASNQSALEVLAQARALQGLPHNPSELSHWTFRIAGLTFRLPNFSWRRAAIDAHDLHHLILGEPFSFAGECQVATWEFAAGPFKDLRAQVFCLPLIAVGALTAPVRTWRSFRSGFAQKSLHGLLLDPQMTLEDLALRAQKPSVPNTWATVRMVSNFTMLLIGSVFLYVVPGLLLIFLFGT